MCRQLPERDYKGLKMAFRELVSMVGGVQRAAHVTRVDKARISLYCNPNSTQFAPMDVVADLEAECGDYVVTRFLAGLAHLELMQRPRGRAIDCVASGIKALSRDAADAVSAMAQAAVDGEISPEEADEIIRETQDLMRSASEVEAHMRRVLEVRK